MEVMGISERETTEERMTVAHSLESSGRVLPGHLKGLLGNELFNLREDAL